MVNTTNLVNIQKFSVFDGDGIRTSIFFKGCALQCAWCHNPESLAFHKDLLYNAERCTACGTCVALCPQKALTLAHGRLQIDRTACNGCGICADECFQSALSIAGRNYSAVQIIKEVEKDRIFYEQSFGGVTFSGGECMLQNPDFIVGLAKQFKQRGYHIAVDTSGYAPQSTYARILPFVDVFLFDLKYMNARKHKQYTGHDNRKILDNLIYLNEHHAAINIRLPLIKTVNATPAHMVAVISFLNQHHIAPVQINLLPYHNTGLYKYDRMNLPYPKQVFETPTQKELEELQALFEQEGFTNVKIGG